MLGAKMGTKSLFIVAFSLLAVAILGFLVTLFSAPVREQEAVVPAAVFPVPESRRVSPGTTRTPVEQTRAPEPPSPQQETGALQAPVLPEFVPKIKRAVERIVESGVVALSPSFAPSSSPSATDIPSGILITPPPPGVPQPLTELEIFNLLYPDFYLETLRSGQRFLIDQGAMKSEEASAFATEREVREFNERFLAYLLERKLIDTETVDRARRSMDELFGAAYEFKLQEALAVQRYRAGDPASVGKLVISPEEAEREFEELIRSQGSHIREINLDVPPASAAPGQRLVLSRYLTEFGKLLSNVLISPARAATCTCFCDTTPVCFQEGPSGGPVGANQVPVVCCRSFGCCPGPLNGCFNRCAGRPFIWDPTTLICGC